MRRSWLAAAEVISGGQTNTSILKGDTRKIGKHAEAGCTRSKPEKARAMPWNSKRYTKVVSAERAT